MPGVEQTDQAWMEEHLAALGVTSARPRLIVHSRFWSFGKLIGGPEALNAALLNVAGSDATIAAPTYTTELGPDDPYDPATAIPHGMGAYSNYILKQLGRIRSLCPIHNHAAIGPEAAGLLTAANGTCSIGPGSDFEWFFDADFDLLLLGCGFAEGATYLHHLEAIFEVPYRRWTMLDRCIMSKDGGLHRMKVRYFARNDAAFIENFSEIERRLVESGDVARVAAPYGASLLVPVRRLHTLVADALNKDPYLLVSERKAVET